MLAEVQIVFAISISVDYDKVLHLPTRYCDSTRDENEDSKGSNTIAPILDWYATGSTKYHYC